MIKRNGDNVFAIASSDQCGGTRGAVSLCPGGGGAATRIPRATAAVSTSASAVRMTPPDAHHNTKEANIALSTYVEKWKNKYEEAERKHKAYLLKTEKGQYLLVNFIARFFVVSRCFCFCDCTAHARIFPGSYANETPRLKGFLVFVDYKC